ncbi:uracil-xanthine permease family protein [Acuticoccus sediminis]|uniref:uracil-xanthine permease family protein n=1 Tax=Acuticoccus sediminis TaxID=2184697 RepID=UPI001CFE0DC7|nr:nucleobase:cation symporter-2 family protein [Acuticoccus sediminis]
MQDNAAHRHRHHEDVIYRLEDKPAFTPALLAATQHLLAAFVNIIAPAIVIGAALGLGPYVPYLIATSLFVSGVATWIQSQKVGPVGSGLLSLQGTSFAFVAALITSGKIAQEGGATPEEVLATIFGVCAVASFIEIGIAYALPWLRRVITPVVSGSVVVLIGMSLILVSIRDIGGGVGAADFGNGTNVMLAAFVVAVILGCQFSTNPMIRVSSIVIGLVTGTLLALFTGNVASPNFSGVPIVSVPIPFRFGLAFDWVSFIPIAFMFVITSLETMGDITGTSRVSGEPTEGKVFEERVKGGVLADGVNSLLAALFATFPNTTFSQNTGVVQLTGVASRHVGRYIAVILVILGLFPILGAVLQQIPRPVLGGSTFVMFSLIVVSGIRIIGSQHMTKKDTITVALSVGMGLGVQLLPDVLNFLPPLWKQIFSSGITTGGLTAILCGLLLPEHVRRPALQAQPSEAS